MKVKKITLAIALTTFMMFILTAITSQSQIQFMGLYDQGEGAASWNADGTGPESAAIGHVNPFTGSASTFYISSRDYVTQNLNHAGFHLLPDMSGFPDFLQTLTDNGYTPEQVKVKVGLGTYEEDIEGEDWLTLGNDYYANHYNMSLSFELDGESLLSGNISYLNHSRTGTATYWYVNSSYCEIADASAGGIASDIATAFLNDIEGTELQIYFEMTVAAIIDNTNGRDGYYFNILNGAISSGLPTIPFHGLPEDNEGAAAWNADGTGPEPLRNGHNNSYYYGASRDYDGIDPDPNAAFGHFLENSEGFTNFLLQLEYRGYILEQVKIKAGICDMDEDIEGEDWQIINGVHHTNEYHSYCTVELDGEALLGFMVDTTFLVHETNWNITSSPAIVYDASQNSSSDVQFVAQSFFKDLGSRQLQMDYSLTYLPAFYGNGRDGTFFQVNNGHLIAKESNCTRVYEGDVSGTWMASCSPYIIEGDLTVPNGETLIIEPGVWVKFMDRYPINVQGSVVAEGDNTNTGGIVFTAVNPDKGWGGFDIVESVATESISFDNCIFEYGSAYGENLLNAGGAIAIANFDNVTIDNCIFRYNKAIFQMGGYYPCAGAIGLYNSSPVIRNSIFFNNYTTYIGGAIMCLTGSNPDISRCLFHNNTADEDGGAIEIWNSNPTLINNTFSLNHAEHWGGAINVYLESNPDFVNCIFWGNTAVQYNQISIYTGDCNPNINYCNVEGGEAGIGPYGNGTYENNLEVDPAFAQELAWDFHLSDASPCINTGDPSIIDPDGTISEMGAFYYSIPLAPVAIDWEEITSTSFYAKWEMDFAVTGYILDVATDESFDTLVPGYESLDVGYTYIYEVTVPSSNTPYYYRLSAYNAAGASDYSNTILVFITNIEETLPESSSGLIVVPNPVNSQGNITLELNEASDVQIEIFNYTGQKVLYITPGKQQEGLVNIPLDLSLLSPGSYICKVTTNKSVHTTKFIKY